MEWYERPENAVDPFVRCTVSYHVAAVSLSRSTTARIKVMAVGAESFTTICQPSTQITCVPRPTDHEACRDDTSNKTGGQPHSDGCCGLWLGEQISAVCFSSSAALPEGKGVLPAERYDKLALIEQCVTTSPQLRCYPSRVGPRFNVLGHGDCQLVAEVDPCRHGGW